MRVKIIKEFVMESFPSTPLLNYALEVEKITTSKKPNLILNVDGVIAVAFCDVLRHSGGFTRYNYYIFICITFIYFFIVRLFFFRYQNLQNTLFKKISQIKFV